jgi:hypothetical protein
MLTCVSSKTGSQDVVRGFREAKMESSGGGGGSISKAASFSLNDTLNRLKLQAVTFTLAKA